MITRAMLCQCIIDEFCRTYNQKTVSPGDITKSSKLAVAMEYLGMLKTDEDKEYAQSRGGVLFIHIDKENSNSSILTFRELLNMLPE